MYGATFSAISQARSAAATSSAFFFLAACFHSARIVCTITSRGEMPLSWASFSATARVLIVVALVFRPAPGRAPPLFGRDPGLLPAIDQRFFLALATAGAGSGDPAASELTSSTAPAGDSLARNSVYSA